MHQFLQSEFLRVVLISLTKRRQVFLLWLCRTAHINHDDFCLVAEEEVPVGEGGGTGEGYLDGALDLAGLDYLIIRHLPLLNRRLIPPNSHQLLIIKHAISREFSLMRQLPILCFLGVEVLQRAEHDQFVGEVFYGADDVGAYFDEVSHKSPRNRRLTLNHPRLHLYTIHIAHSLLRLRLNTHAQQYNIPVEDQTTRLCFDSIAEVAV
jgi:hypothetical protein